MFPPIITCLLYTSDAADDSLRVDLGGRRIINKIPGVPVLIRTLYQVNHPKLEKELFGIKFKNPVGLAAGFDKDAKLFRELSNFGFGFIEIGTLTPQPQSGNPKKRLFRLLEDEGLINRMGFNNEGVEAVIPRLRKNNNIIGLNVYIVRRGG